MSSLSEIVVKAVELTSPSTPSGWVFAFAFLILAGYLIVSWFNRPEEAPIPMITDSYALPVVVEEVDDE